MSVNLFPYDTSIEFHRQNKLACNLYLGGEYLVDVLYVYIKLYYINILLLYNIYIKLLY